MCFVLVTELGKKFLLLKDSLLSALNDQQKSLNSLRKGKATYIRIKCEELVQGKLGKGKKITNLIIKEKFFCYYVYIPVHTTYDCMSASAVLCACESYTVL